MEHQNQMLMLIAVVAALVAYFFFFQKKEGLMNVPKLLSASPNDSLFLFSLLMSAKYGAEHPKVQALRDWIRRQVSDNPRPGKFSIPTKDVVSFERSMENLESEYQTFFRSIGSTFMW